MSDLEALTDELFDTVDALLGDTIVYTPAGGGAVLTLTAFADQGEVRRDFGGSAAISADAAVEIRKADLPTWAKGDVIRLPDGRDYQPADVRTDESGRCWRMLLKRKVA